MDYLDEYCACINDIAYFQNYISDLNLNSDKIYILGAVIYKLALKNIDVYDLIKDMHHDDIWFIFDYIGCRIPLYKKHTCAMLKIKISYSLTLPDSQILKIINVNNVYDFSSDLLSMSLVYCNKYIGTLFNIHIAGYIEYLTYMNPKYKYLLKLHTNYFSQSNRSFQYKQSAEYFISILEINKDTYKLYKNCRNAIHLGIMNDYLNGHYIFESKIYKFIWHI